MRTLPGACRRFFAIPILLAVLAGTADAIVVRGTVSDPLGRPVPGARVTLIQGKLAISAGVSGTDGVYEIRSTAQGRFVLIVTSAEFAPQVSEDFYGGRTAETTRDLALDRALIYSTGTVAVSGIRLAPEQLSSRLEAVAQDELATRIGPADALALAPGSAFLRQGQTGPASLSVRGGGGAANKVTVDGISAEDPGGGFNLGDVASTAVRQVEVLRGANAALDGANAEASALSLATRRGTSLRPVFDYSGDGGNLHAWRNEAVLSGTRGQLDYLAGYSRFDSSNALPLDRSHGSTAVADLGYSILTGTVARFTLRNTDAAAGLPGPHDLFGLSANGRRADQDLYAGVAVEERIGNSRTVVRYGIARKRAQTFDYTPVGQPVASGGATTYYGNPITLRGANGYQATGQAAMSYPGAYPAREDDAANRDELSVQSEYRFSRRFAALAGFRFEDERGEAVNPFSARSIAQNAKLDRVNFDCDVQLQGDIFHRVFYSAGGAVEKNGLLGLEGNPRIGVAYVPVRIGSRWMRGTKVYGNAATGFGEPGERELANSLSATLTAAGDAAAIAQYRLSPLAAPRSRTFEAGVDQSIRGSKLVFRASYFHSQFSHQFDRLDPGTMKLLFGVAPQPLQPDAVDDSLAWRAQGMEGEIRYQPLRRLYVHGGYTYLSTVVERSFAAGGFVNPNLPGIPIGSSYPLSGARPFQIPPHTGFFAVQYTGTRFTAAFQGALASRSDDGTGQAGNDRNGGNTLLLPNRDLDFAYAKLDGDFTFQASKHVTVFTQLDNLLNDQHIGPIGYPGLPFTVRAGLKIRMGGD